MVKIGLKIKVSFENVDKLYPLEPEKFGWALKIKCTGCGEENPNWHIISEEDEIELVNATANFVYKCKCCGRENSIKIIHGDQLSGKSKKKNIDLVYLNSDEDTFKTIVGFDCRGVEPIDFEPREGWAIQSGKKIFDNVDLSSKEWCEYNDVDNVPVEISNFESMFEAIK